MSHCIQEVEVHYNPLIPHDYSQDYLTTVALEDGTISFNILKSMGTDMITSISYSIDEGETWETVQNQDDKQEHLAIDVYVNEGDKVLWKGDAQQMGYYDQDEYGDYVGSFFSSTCEFDVEGNMMSLLYGDDFKGEDTLEYEGQFACLFYDYDEEKECKVVNARNLSLSATTLVEGCYSSMFQGCTSLTTAPELPATALTRYCYSNMFYDCTNLTSAPELPATTLADSCYYNMFSSCASLTTAPELPATILKSSCYNSMFQGCTSLTTAPELPATTLAINCYGYMFRNCTSLTTAPELLATILAESCYSNIFNGCSNLNYIKCLATDKSAAFCTSYWVSGVASSGTFVKAASMTSWPSGTSGIPSNWTVQDA